MTRNETKQIHVGGVAVGGGAPVSVQSMCNTPTADAEATLAQIRRLADAGCDIIRVAVPDGEAADAMARICAESPLPVVADIHFDYRLALHCAEAVTAKDIAVRMRMRATSMEMIFFIQGNPPFYFTVVPTVGIQDYSLTPPTLVPLAKYFWMNG